VALQADHAHAAGEAAKGEEADDRVHVFTVASGHMYERLQKIMILSVLRNTKSVASASGSLSAPVSCSMPIVAPQAQSRHVSDGVLRVQGNARPPCVGLYPVRQLKLLEAESGTCCFAGRG
jgi:Glucosyltransferase 24